MEGAIAGEHTVLAQEDERYPPALLRLPDAPQKLFVIGNVGALQEGLAVVGARKATPYGKGCARRFARRAARRGIVIISGGARGCDAEAHRAALAEHAPTVVFMGGGCHKVYPAQHAALFQEVVEAGGALVSEHEWEASPRPFMFRMRNRLIAGLAKATLIVEAGLPSGTFSTADEALRANRDVLVVPGSIESVQSRGANRLIYQGATPIVDDDAFDERLCSLFGLLRQEEVTRIEEPPLTGMERKLIDALTAAPLSAEELFSLAVQEDGQAWTAAALNGWIALMETKGFITRYPGGKYGAQVKGGGRP